MLMQLRHAAGTDVGRARDHNEDTFAVEEQPEHPEAGRLFVVCDGMGGYASGEVASGIAAETIVERYFAAAGDPGPALRAAFTDANQRIYTHGHGKMGTTGVAALFLADAVLLANVGDSRAYLIRNGQPRQLTRDHSFVEEQVSAGVITANQARESSYRNIITRALGHRPDVEVDLYTERLKTGDRVLLCSDGLHGQVTPEEIAEIAGTQRLEAAVSALVALANERGGPDNITAVLIEVLAVAAGAGVGQQRAATERLPASPQATSSGGTARLHRDGPVAADTRRSLQQPAQPHQHVAPPLAAAPPRRGPILGMILMTLIGLALLTSVVWFVLGSGATSGAGPSTPTVPRLTPLNATAGASSGASTAAPTFVPTTAPQATTP
jgi:protein phosphatase